MKSVIRKMGAQFGDPINYYVRIDEQQIELNSLIGQHIHLQFTGQIFCQECNKKIKHAELKIITTLY
jgi:hypothetical protein